MTLLQGEQLTCIKRDRVLFEQYNCDFATNQITHIVGPNGAGKTSLLRILAGLSQPTDGVVKYQKQPIVQVSELMCQHLVYVGHKGGLHAMFSAFENLQFWCAQQGIEGSPEYIMQTLSKLGLAGLEDLPVNMLSAGQYRRVALARLWLKQQAKLWILDEPYTALDTKGIDLVESEVVKFASQGGCVIMTSHQPLGSSDLIREIHLEYRF